MKNRNGQEAVAGVEMRNGGSLDPPACSNRGGPAGFLALLILSDFWLFYCLLAHQLEIGYDRIVGNSDWLILL